MPDQLSRRARASLLMLIFAACAPIAAHAGTTTADPPAPGGRIGIGVAEIPASRLDDPRARVYIDDHVNPGTTFTRALKVFNFSAKTWHITLHAGGAAIRNHRFTFASPPAGNELTSWIRLNRTKLDLRPGAGALVRATIAVPAWASEGERYAVIWARVASPKPGPGTNIALVNLVGVRAYLHVGPGGEPATDFEIGQVHPRLGADGDYRVVATVTNTGHRAIDVQGRLYLLEGPGRLKEAGPYPIARGTTLAPGEEAEVTVPLGRGVPDGRWKYRLTVQSGRVSRTATGTLTLSRGPAAPHRALALLPLLLAGLGCAALTLLAAIVHRRVRERVSGRQAG
ncbi:hypothetical protein ABZU32_35260 [Sphaerisporangium sp. NPDC005288]|uniref:hypothetical protein n=1 Tax=Sphaerisporangium sp. NPDC005288 TaxID=3155114 RepID=UPI0033AC263E